MLNSLLSLLLRTAAVLFFAYLIIVLYEYGFNGFPHGFMEEFPKLMDFFQSLIGNTPSPADPPLPQQ